MAFTDQQVLTAIQRQLIETPDGGVTVSSGLWTPNEMIEAINTAQLWMLREAWPVVNTATLITVPNQLRYDLPGDWMMTTRVTWTTADGDIATLGRDSSWSADYLDYDWTYNYTTAAPLVYTDIDGSVPQIQVMPASQDNGVLDIWYVALPTPLSNTGVAWVLPDPLVLPCQWKALAILLGKDGRGQDGPRAVGANQRAEQGLEAARIMLGGWRGGV